MPQSKKSTSGMGSIRKITKISKGKEYTYYEARFTEGFDPGTGKQIQRSISGKSKKEVAQKLKAATAAIDAGNYKAPCKMTVGQWLDIWVAEYLNSVKPLTKHNYNKQVQKHFKPAFGAVRMDALDTHTIQRFYSLLRGCHPRRSRTFTEFCTVPCSKQSPAIIFLATLPMLANCQRSSNRRSSRWSRKKLPGC